MRQIKQEVALLSEVLCKVGYHHMRNSAVGGCLLKLFDGSLYCWNAVDYSMYCDLNRQEETLLYLFCLMLGSAVVTSGRWGEGS